MIAAGTDAALRRHLDLAFITTVATGRRRNGTRFRRQGVQTALLSTRLADAAAAGCDIAVVTTAPGSKSQQNVHRQGFQLLYTRACSSCDSEYRSRTDVLYWCGASPDIR